MSSLVMRRAVATALAGAIIVSAIGATAASARPMAPASVSVEAASVAPPPSSIAAPAGDAYEELRSPAPGDPKPVVAEPTESSGFDLPSAAIGAATGAGLLIVVLAAAGLPRRRPLTRRHDAIGA